MYDLAYAYVGLFIVFSALLVFTLAMAISDYTCITRYMQGNAVKRLTMNEEDDIK